MKSTGIVRRIDPLGRIVIPIELRNIFNIDNNIELEIFVDKDQIVLKKYSDRCYLCGRCNELIIFKNKKVCRKCIDELERYGI